MPARTRIRSLIIVLAALVAVSGVAGAQTYLDLENQIQEFTLDNGVHFIVLEKHDVPVFSFRTYVNVGSANELRGITGISHILEHMAFKGTSEIGGNNLKKERQAMALEDQAFAALKQGRLEIVPRIEKLTHQYERKAGRVPEARREAFNEVEVLLHDPAAEVSLLGDGRVTIMHGAGTEEEKVDHFNLEGEELAALEFYVDRIQPLEKDFAQREQAFEDAKDAAREFVVTNEFGQIIEENGGNGLNASTSSDVTRYHYNFPSNRLELWAYLEGSRMSDPILREFYTEKDGPVTEERRMRTDNNPIGRLIELFQNQMFMANGYHHSTIGYMSDINNISRADCQAYYDQHYVGSNMVVTIVGDVYMDDVQKFAKKYFSKIPKGSPSPVETFEPVQLIEKRMVMQDPSQPVFIAGYHIENVNHPDWPVYEVISDVLGQGRTSRLHKNLVKDQKIAVNAACFSGYPGMKYQSGMLVFAMPVKGKTGYDMEEAILLEIDNMVNDGITAEELEAVKQRARANFIRGLRGNGGMAEQLAWYQTYTGDWRDLFQQAEEIEAVTLEDVKRVAGDIFVKSNRTIAIIETEDQDS